MVCLQNMSSNNDYSSINNSDIRYSVDTKTFRLTLTLAFLFASTQISRSDCRAI